MCGGPAQIQKDAAAQTAQLSSAELGQFNKASAVTNPFFSNLVTNPGQDPALAQQYRQQEAQMKARNAGYGDALPSGFAQQQQTDLGEQYGRTQDANMLQRQQFGAQGLNPQASASVAAGANQSIMQAPLQNSFWSNLIGGILGSGAGFKTSGGTAFAI